MPAPQIESMPITSIKENPNFWDRSYFPALDGLRTLSFLLVVGYHTRTDSPIKHYVNGVLGVGFFFVISGFLITTLLLRERRASGSFSIRQFYTRRAFRIIPMYLFTLAVYGCLALAPSQHILKEKLLRALPYDLSLRNEYIPAQLDVPFTHSWSLSIEEKFYLAWPIILLFLIRKPRLGWLIAPVAVLTILISPAGLVTVGYFSILLGCGVAILLEWGRDRQDTVQGIIQRIPTSIWFLMWAIGYLFSLRGEWPFVSSIGTALLLAKLLVDNSWLSRAFGAPVLQWTGKRTYSMYLLHAFCLSAVQDHFFAATTSSLYFAVIASVFLLALAAGSVTYSLIELPLIRFGKRWTGLSLQREKCLRMASAAV